MSAAAFDGAEARAAPPRDRPLWVIPLLALLLLQAGAIFRLHGEWFAGIGDADTLMRLARIKYVLATHGWHGGFFPRDNAPYGMVLHWSMLFDLPIIALAGLLSLFVPFATALSLAGIFTGPLIAYVVLWAAWGLGRPVMSPRAREFACLAVAISPAPLGYGGIGRANHHIGLVLMMVLVAGLMLRLWIDRRSVRPAVLAGIAAAVSAWLSFELVALALVPAVLLLALLWIREGAGRLRQNLAFAATLAFCMTVFLLLDPPDGGYGVVVLDRLSAPYLCFAWLVLAVWGVVRLLMMRGQFSSWRARLSVGILLGTCAAVGLITLYPAILGGVNGQIDPIAQTEFNGRVSETQPAYANFNQFVQSAYLGCLGTAASFVLLRRRWRGGSDRLGWIVLTAIVVGLSGLGIAHVRFTPYSAIAGAFLLAVLVDETELASDRLVGRYARVVAMILALAIPFGAAYLPSGNEEADAKNPARDCKIFAIRAALDDPAWFGEQAGIIATDIDSVPPTLYWTPHGTLFGPYHRNAQGLHDLLALFRDTGDDKARGIVAARGIDAFLICAAHPAKMLMTPDGGAPDPNDKSDGTLFRRLAEGHPPVWLKSAPWPEGVKTGYVLYRVDRAALKGAD